MKKWLYAGTALLILQLVLAVILHNNDREFAAFTPQVALLKFSPSTVDAISLFGEDQQNVQLRRINGKWLLPDKFNAPADEGKVTDILEKLATLKQGLIVAKTKGAAKRFKVSEDNFVRHVVLKSGDQKIADFFLGTSPSFKMVHARVSDHQEIVSVAINTYDLALDLDNWIDRRMAQVKKEEIIKLMIGDNIILTKTDNTWRLSGLTDNEEINTEEVDNLLEKVSRLPVDGIIEPSENSRLFEKDPELTITINLHGGEKKQYTFVKQEEENHYVMKTSDKDFYLKVNSWTIDDLKKFNRSILVKDKDLNSEQGESGSTTEAK